MTSELLVHEYDEYPDFTRNWPTDVPDESMRSRWQLLGRLDPEDVLVVIPEWLVEGKVGFVDGATPTEFVGRIERETGKAVLLRDAAEARPLARLAHRMTHLEDGIAAADGEPDRREWLEGRLDDVRDDFENRAQFVGLQEEWLPKSQLVHVARRI